MAKGSSRKREGDHKDLWTENRMLRKQVKSLQREANRLRRELGKAANYIVEEDDEMPEERVKRESALQCKKCASHDTKLLEIDMRGKKVGYIICQNCGQRTKAQST
jgi:dynactin complex subunit